MPGPNFNDPFYFDTPGTIGQQYKGEYGSTPSTYVDLQKRLNHIAAQVMGGTYDPVSSGASNLANEGLLGGITPAPPPVSGPVSGQLTPPVGAAPPVPQIRPTPPGSAATRITDAELQANLAELEAALAYNKSKITGPAAQAPVSAVAPGAPQTPVSTAMGPGRGPDTRGSLQPQKVRTTTANEPILDAMQDGPIRQAAFGPQSPSGNRYAPASGGPNYDYKVNNKPTGESILSWVANNGNQYTARSNTNLHSSGAVPPTSNSATTTSSNTVLCTYFMKKGWLSKRLWWADTKFSRTLPAQWRRGYLRWALPLVRRMEKGDVVLERLLWPVVRAWAGYAAYKMGRQKFSPTGWLVHQVLGRVSAKLGA